MDAAVTPLKQHRLASGHQPEASAAHASMSVRTLMRWEKNGIPTRPNHGKRAERIAKLAELYGVSVEELVGEAA